MRLRYIKLDDGIKQKYQKNADRYIGETLFMNGHDDWQIRKRLINNPKVLIYDQVQVGKYHRRRKKQTVETIEQATVARQ